MKLLATRSRSEAELRQRLSQKGPRENVEHCIARLKEMGLIDDRRFAESFARSMLNSKPIGRSKVAAQLAAKGVDRQTVSEALDAVFDEEANELAIDRAIGKHLRMHGTPGNRDEARKLFAYLARLGFDFDLIRRRLRVIAHDVDGPAGG